MSGLGLGISALLDLGGEFEARKENHPSCGSAFDLGLVPFAWLGFEDFEVPE